MQTIFFMMMRMSGMHCSNVMWRTVVGGENAQSIRIHIKVTGSDVCLYFDGEEYGVILQVVVPYDTYSLSKDDHLYDVENDEIPIRNLNYY